MQYGFDQSQVRVSSKAELNRYITDEQIFHHYLGDFTLNEYICSPRGEDNPSMLIDFHNGEIQWRDFGYDPRPGDAVNLVQYLEDLQGRQLKYHDAIQKIRAEVNGDVPYVLDVDKIEKEKADLRVRYRRDFMRHEAAYWRSQKLKKATIRHFKVFPCEIWYDDRCWHHSRSGDPLFVFLWHSQNGIWKGYRPLAPRDQVRFIESNCQDQVQGWQFMVEHESCIITKSYKDVMAYYELGMVAVAPRSENQFLSPNQVNYLKNKYKRLYINFDPDDAGIRNMTKYSEEFDIPTFHFEDEGVKDLTELRIETNDRYVKSCLDARMR